MTRILIADDDANLRYSLRRMFAGRGYAFVEAADGEQAVELVLENPPDIVVMDVRMPRMGGLEAFDRIKTIAPELPVIMMTAYGTTDTAIEAMKRGAFDYTLKPFRTEEIMAIFARAERALSTRGASVRIEPEDRGEANDRRLVGSGRAMQAVYKVIGQVAETDVHVLLLGESGTGKELVARAVHGHSPRSAAAFVAINCAAVPESLIESELFGHEKGAFTGADTSKDGLLEASHGGTLLLDEIGDMPLSAQAKMLRFFQEGEVVRVGASAPVKLDVRVIAASNRDLEKAVAEGTFRGDLLYRLNSVCIDLPPLRDHLEDLPELISYFVNRFNREFGKSFTDVSAAALHLLSERPWPGNVRELENVVRKAVLVGHGEVLLPEHVAPGYPVAEAAAMATEDGSLEDEVEASVTRLIDILTRRQGLAVLPTLERLFIAEALARTGGNQVKAASLLGISRNTLRNRIARYAQEEPS